MYPDAPPPLYTLGHYVFLLGVYRFMYILNWVYRAYHESQYYHRPLLYFAALVQTLLYIDFFYYYVTRYVRRGYLVISL